MVRRADMHCRVNPAVTQNATELFSRFASARPFPHVVIDGFLSESFCADLCRQVEDANSRLNRSWLYSAELRLRRRLYELESSTPLRIMAPVRALRQLLNRKAGGNGGPSQRHD